VRSLLAADGHEVTWLRSYKNWLEQERDLQPDIVLAAVPQTDAVLAAANRPGVSFPPPLLFVQQEGDFLGEAHLEGRLVDRLASPFMQEELLARVDALVRVRRIVGRQAASEASAGRSVRPGLRRRVSSWLRDRLPEQERPAGPYLEVAARVAEWADRRDAYEPGHAERVTSFCAMIAEGLGMPEHETTELLRAAMLHDIGKVALPVEILHQPGPLRENQRRLVRTHPARGAALLRALNPDDRVARVVLYHHERPDGAGYYGKAADGIPLSSSALAVAEAYDAMTKGKFGVTVSSEEALDQLLADRGTAYDGECVEALVDALRPRARSIPLSSV
jgi:HD-GYP domain-containing protein (c-di-GMP phosphodiesterase class II)